MSDCKNDDSFTFWLVLIVLLMLADLSIKIDAIHKKVVPQEVKNEQSK